MLWTMRRPWLKSLGRATPRLFRPERRARMLESMKSQNRFARRIGLPLLTLSINLLLASMIVTTSYLVILKMYESGYLQPSEAMKR
jgi:hypothetical protein